MVDVEIIKGNPELAGKKKEMPVVNKKRMAAYCRVSTDAAEQLESYQSQVKYYKHLIDSNPEWDLVDIYADEAVTGTMIDHRENFKRLINDCLDGRIDIVITKSISRFARNTLDVLRYVRLLKDKQIGVIFEEEHINTLSMDGELLLSVLSAVYQQEVENTSSHVVKGMRMKMMRGEIVGFSGCLGYDYNPDTKQLIINESEAEIVRLIFRLYLKGHGGQYICKELERRGYKTKRGNSHWEATTIRGILRNDSYTGVLRQGKTYTVDPIRKKRNHNYGEADQYVVRGHHDAIISEEEFEKAKEIRLARTNCGHPRGEHFISGLGLYTFTRMIDCGFCEGKLTRRTWHARTEYEKIIWQCHEAIRQGKAYCPHSAGISEKAIEDAFIKSYQKMNDINSDVIEETIKRIEEGLGTDILAKSLKDGQKEVKKLEMKMDALLDLRLNHEVEEDTYKEKYEKIYKSLGAARKKLEEVQKQVDEQESQEMRLKRIRKLLTEKKELEEFDPDLFLSLVEKVIVGGYDENGEPDPSRIVFVYRTGPKDKMDGSKFKTPRKNARKLSTEGGQTDNASHADATDKLCSLRTSEVEENVHIECSRDLVYELKGHEGIWLKVIEFHVLIHTNYSDQLSILGSM